MQTMPEKVQSVPQLRELFGGGNVRGSVVRAHLDWVRDHRDRTEVIEFFEALPFAMRVVVTAAWYPFENVVNVDRLILSRFGNDDLRVLQDAGAYAARQDVKDFNRHPQRSGVHEFFRTLARLHGQFQDYGTARYREECETRGRMIREKEVSCSPIYCATLTASYRESIRLHGGMNVNVSEPQCQSSGATSCEYEFVWT